jgi:hypothetical protein
MLLGSQMDVSSVTNLDISRVSILDISKVANWDVSAITILDIYLAADVVIRVVTTIMDISGVAIEMT